VSADDLESLARYLRTNVFGRAHEHHASIDSTNDRAAAWARAGAPHGAVVTADEQTNGRGRRGRSWHSPAGDNLYVSVVARPGPVGASFGALGLAVAVALREALPDVPAGVDFKWPNDLLVGERKIAGILCESRWCGNEPEVVIGFGINVHGTAFPPELEAIATSLALELGSGVALQRVPLLADILASLETTLETFVAGGFASIRDRYEPYCTILGRPITVGADEHLLAVGLDHDGALLVRPIAGGPTRRVETADIWFAPGTQP
jgi:BirA family transcriptional regulator, biotin operon repressor / biotin---[acetyl-CoA-carboxylase] ligase